MGGFCSCFHVPDDDDSTSVDCSCAGCLFQKLKDNHGNRFTQQTQSKDVIPPPNQQASASNHDLVLSNAAAASRPHGPLQVQPEPVGKSDITVGTIALQGVRKLLIPDPLGLPQLHRLKSCAKDESRHTDVDECPTCLEEYTPENPKKMTKCSHHYHLSCIYEWMERNENCPVCGKLMLFDE